MNRNLLIALLSVWWYVSPFSSAIKDGKAVKGTGSGLVTIFKLNTRVCNGILVDKSWILTAGKCIDDRYLHEYRLSIKTKDGKSIDRGVLYTERPTNSEDVVLIKTTKALMKRTQKIIFGNSASDKEYTKCKLLGYSDVEQKPIKAFLKESAGCDNAGNKNVLCFDAEKASVCSEYTGAPIICRTSQNRFLAGLALVEGRCNTKSISGIRISFYERWIRQVLDAVDCGHPKSLENGTVDLEVPGKTTFGAKASVICNTGFIASTTAVSCGKDGIWSPATCSSAGCGIPETVDNGVIDLEKPGETTFGAKASLICNSGFIASTPTVTCGTDGIWSSATCNEINDCRQWRDNGFTTDGIYSVQLWKSRVPIQVYCDMQTDGGGWTVFQKRFDKSLGFYRGLDSYENGFGNLTGEFWTGLRYVQEISQLGKTELRLDLTTIDLTRSFYSVFQDFHLGSDNFYVLNIGARSGSPIWSTTAWWFNLNARVDLNAYSIYHNGFDPKIFDFGSSKMMFRRV